MNTSRSHTRRALDELSATHLGQPPHETTLLVTKHTVQIPEQVPEAQTPAYRHMQTDARIHTKTQTHIHTHPSHRKNITAPPPPQAKAAQTRQLVALDHLRALD